ncbi:hypothetical protein CRG98_006493 [Punica granatum]|uniref:Uncharacterized protein n=1 Tax=Punica granatum TaxID=22663 RepID=A0A2I0KX79_PUNGR|nr:hypothetical protein CRG98_006493 [Punica granatum]
MESLFPLDEEVGPASIAAFKVLTNFDSDFLEPKSDTCYLAAEVIGEVNQVNSVPHVPISIYSSKYAKPIKVIAFIDAGAIQTIMSPGVLSKDCWKPRTKHFSTASSEVFSTHFTSKSIKIQFFMDVLSLQRC